MTGFRPFFNPATGEWIEYTTLAEDTGGALIYSPQITAGADGNIWFTNSSNNTIGRITAKGRVSDYTGAGISQPTGITAGPDGALWFTNWGNGTIGRITRSGRIVSNYTGPGVSNPAGITPGPDGALWFTNHGSASIGKITTNCTPEIDSSPWDGDTGTKVISKSHSASDLAPTFPKNVRSCRCECGFAVGQRHRLHRRVIGASRPGCDPLGGGPPILRRTPFPS